MKNDNCICPKYYGGCKSCKNKPHSRGFHGPKICEECFIIHIKKKLKQEKKNNSKYNNILKCIIM